MPWDRSKYPPDWEERRARVLARAGHRCEACGVPNYSVGYRDPAGAWVPVSAASAPELHTRALNPALLDGCGRGEESHNMARCLVDDVNERGGWHGHRLRTIVLTTAHLDVDGPLDCPDDRLAAWCQRCHNRYDVDMRRRHASQTRRARLGVGDLFA